jgi:tetratricopeptide (TPR) repeat protein
LRANRARVLTQFTLAIALVGLFATTVAAQEATDDVPIYMQPRFDRIVLKSGDKVDVQPLRFNGTRIVPSPQPTTGSLSIKPLQATQGALEYSVEWSKIERVELFEDMIMSEALRLAKSKEFDKAFGYFAHLLKVAPDARGLDQAINEYLQADAMAAFEAGQFDRALAILGSLYERNPQATNMARAVDTVADKIITQYLKDRNYTAARLTLDVVNESFPGLRLTVVNKWRTQFERAAAQQMQEAGRLVEAKSYLAARDAVTQARGYWPQTAGAAELLQRIQREHPVVRVGVFTAPPSNPERRLDSWASTRSAELTSPSLAALRDYSTEGGVYSSPAATITVDDSGLGLTIELTETSAEEGLVLGLGAAALARRLVDATNSTSPNYDEVLANLISEVRVEYPRTVQVTLRRPHVRPEALLEFALPTDLAKACGRSVFTIAEKSDSLVRYVDPAPQPGRLAEVHEIVFDSDEKAVSALARGEIDVLDRVPPWQVKNIESLNNVQVDFYRLPSIHVIAPTGKHPLTQQREFRRALLFGLNREEILKREIMAGSGLPGFRTISGPFPAGVSPSDPIRYAYNSQVQVRDYDPRLAILLASVAWNNVQKAQGIKEPKAPLPTLKLGHSSDPLARTACQSIATNFRPIMNLELVELTSEQMLYDDNVVDLKYLELCLWEPVCDARRLLGGGGLLPDTSDFMAISLDRLDNATRWNDVRTRLYEIHSLSSSDLPVIPLWQTPLQYARHKSVLGLKPQPVRLYQDISDWQLDVGGERL